MKISFVIPCYNSSKNIEKVVKEIEDTVKTRQGYDYEIILVNDYSKDNTADVISRMARSDKHIKAVLLSRNFGQPSALMAGFSYVTGDYIVTSDDDGQTPINTVYDMIDKLENEKYDVICAKYMEREQPSLFRRFGTLINMKMTNWLIKKPKDVYMSAYICARPFVIRELLKYKNAYPYLAGLILRVTHNIGNIETKQRSRNSGNSNYGIKKLMKLWLNGFTAFSVKPLRVSVLIGVACSGVGFITAIVTIIRKLINMNIQAGWSSMFSVILIIGGMILLSLGMIGEYVGRIYMCINDAPQFIVKDCVGFDSDSVEVVECKREDTDEEVK